MTSKQLLQNRDNLREEIEKRMESINKNQGVVALLDAEIMKHQAHEVQALETAPGPKLQAMKDHLKKFQDLYEHAESKATKEFVLLCRQKFETLKDEWDVIEAKGKESLEALKYMANRGKRVIRLQGMRARYQDAKIAAALDAGGWPKNSAKVIAARINKSQFENHDCCKGKAFNSGEWFIFDCGDASDNLASEIQEYNLVVQPLIEAKAKDAKDILKQRVRWPGLLSKLAGCSEPKWTFCSYKEGEWGDAHVPWFVMAKPKHFLWGPSH